jgi:hypothetical protein
LTEIGKLEIVSVRELWQHEEYDFSAWLEQNLDRLSDAVGIQLFEPQREMLAGNFQCDIVTTNLAGDRVIIENQLEQTNHDHLGKLLTYVANLEAKTAIWIATSQRAEHISAVQWLNENSPDDVTFYMVKLTAYKMKGSNLAAPLFTVIVGPSAEAKSFGRQKKELAERHVNRLRFWKQLLVVAEQQGLQIQAQRSPTKNLYLTTGAGSESGIGFTYLIWFGSSGVELYINTGDNSRNEEIFSSLRLRKENIETSFGQPLIWDEMKDNRACRIRFVLPGGGLETKIVGKRFNTKWSLRWRIYTTQSNRTCPKVTTMVSFVHARV